MSILKLPDFPYKALKLWAFGMYEKINEIIDALNSGGGADYKVLTGVIYQNNLDNPVLTIIKNTMTNPITTSKEPMAGQFHILCSDFVAAKTWCLLVQKSGDGQTGNIYTQTMVCNADGDAWITSYFNGSGYNNLNNLYFEIRVYP